MYSIHILVPIIACLGHPLQCDQFQEHQSQSLSAQCTSELLDKIIEYENITNKCAREVHEEVEDGKKILHPENTCSELSTVLNAIKYQF
jgi:hypothetical protein